MSKSLDKPTSLTVERCSCIAFPRYNAFIISASSFVFIDFSICSGVQVAIMFYLLLVDIYDCGTSHSEINALIVFKGI